MHVKTEFQIDRLSLSIMVKLELCRYLLSARNSRIQNLNSFTYLGLGINVDKTAAEIGYYCNLKLYSKS